MNIAVTGHTSGIGFALFNKSAEYVADTIIKEIKPGVTELIISHPNWS